jgi:hypothetical protein
MIEKEMQEDHNRTFSGVISMTEEHQYKYVLQSIKGKQETL